MAAIRRCLSFVAAAALYAGVYFACFPTDKGYFTLSFAPLAKVPHMLAAFLFLEPYTPAAFPFTWRGLLALAAAIAATLLAWRRRDAIGLAGGALAFVPLLPVLLVPYLPTRYTAIPYAGFLLLLLSTLVAAVRRVGRLTRVGALAAAAALGLIAAGAGVLGVRHEIDDATRVSAAHLRLLAEAAAVAPQLPLDRPVAVVRAERDNPLLEIATSPAGLPKLLYVRHPDPYGLIDAAALFEWVLGREDVMLARFDDGERRFGGRRGALLLHESGGFAWVDRDAPDVTAEAARWNGNGLPVRWVLRNPPR